MPDYGARGDPSGGRFRKNSVTDKDRLNFKHLSFLLEYHLARASRANKEDCSRTVGPDSKTSESCWRFVLKFHAKIREFNAASDRELMQWITIFVQRLSQTIFLCFWH